jgi:polysaccharide export outer membrane protein
MRKIDGALVPLTAKLLLFACLAGAGCQSDALYSPTAGTAGAPNLAVLGKDAVAETGNPNVPGVAAVPTGRSSSPNQSGEVMKVTYAPAVRVDAPAITQASCGPCDHALKAPTGPVAEGCVSPAALVPRELDMVSHPPYVVEPPDILQIDAIRLIPKPPYHIEPLDAVVIQVGNVPEDQPISGLFPVEPDGTVNLGFTYGSVPVAGLTLKEAQMTIKTQLVEAKVKDPQVRVAIGQIGGFQQIRGEHLVRPDGTVALGKYGSVYVAGHTLDQAKAAIEARLGQFLSKPEVNVDVAAYNSKTYYIVTDGGGYGEQVYRFPSTGKETVLDALSLINGLPIVASKRRIWVARPAPADAGTYQVLPVDWLALTRGGATATNYQILPGDRIFVEANKLITLDTALARIFSPVERIFGITLLGTAVYRGIATPINGGNGVNGGNGTGTGF